MLLPQRYEVLCTFVIRNVRKEALVMMYESIPPHQYPISYEQMQQPLLKKLYKVSEEIYKSDADDQEISKHRTDDEKLVPMRLCEGVPEAVELQVEDQACEDAPIPVEDVPLADNEEASVLVNLDGTNMEDAPTRPRMPIVNQDLPAVEYRPRMSTSSSETTTQPITQSHTIKWAVARYVTFHDGFLTMF